MDDRWARVWVLGLPPPEQAAWPFQASVSSFGRADNDSADIIGMFEGVNDFRNHAKHMKALNMFVIVSCHYHLRFFKVYANCLQ